jgi:hypothetical protein
MASTDEKSAYDGVHVTPYTPFVYQTIGMQATEFLRSRSIITTQYLDDRFLGPSHFVKGASPRQATGLSLYYSCYCLSYLGYTFAYNKVIWSPRLELKHVGFHVHSDRRNFSVPADKITSFNALRAQILAKVRSM